MLVENTNLLGNGSPPRVFIQFVCATSQTVGDVQDADGHCLFAKHLLENISAEDVNVADIFRRIANALNQESQHTQRLLSMGNLNEFNNVYLKKTSGTYRRKFDSHSESF